MQLSDRYPTAAARRDVKAVWKCQLLCVGSTANDLIFHFSTRLLSFPSHKQCCFFLFFFGFFCLLNESFQSNVSVNPINSQSGSINNARSFHLFVSYGFHRVVMCWEGSTKPCVCVCLCCCSACDQGKISCSVRESEHRFALSCPFSREGLATAEMWENEQLTLNLPHSSVSVVSSN